MNIKRILLSFLMVVAVATGLHAQVTGVTDSVPIISPNAYHIPMPSMRSTGSSQWYTVAQYGVYNHVLVVTVNGTLTTLTIVLEGSNDQVTATTIGTSTDPAGARITGDGAYNYVRARITVYSGTGRVTPSWTGFPTQATSGGGGGGGGGDTNLTQINGNTVNAGVGAGASGTQRVALSTDSIIASITAPVVITGAKSNNGAVPGATNLGVLPVVATAAAPTYTEGNQAALSTTLSGLVRVAIEAGGGTGGTASSFGAAFPATGTALGFSDGSVMRPGLAVDGDTGGGTQYIQRVILGVSGSGGSVEVGTAASPLRTDPTGTTNQPVIGTKTNNAAAPGTNNLGVLPCLANAASPTFTEGNLVNCSVTLAGAERVVGTGTAGTANAGVVTIQGIASMTPVQVSQATAANLNATIVGTKTNNNATPGATNLGVLPAVASTSAPSYTDTDMVALSTDLSGSLRVNVVSGSTGNAAASATGSSVPAQADYTGINVGGTLRGQTGTNTSGSVYAADVNIVGAPAITYNATQPTKTDGQTVTDFQITSRGALVVNPGVENFPVSAVITTGSAQIGHLEANQSSNVAQINGVTPLMGAGNTGTGSPRVTIASDQANLPVISGTAPVVTMNSASANAGVTSANAYVFDDTGPTSITENSFGYARMSANRNQYATLRDAAGNERGANVTAANELLVSVGNAALTVRGFGTAGVSDSNVLTVQGIASGTPVLATLTGTNNINNVSGTVSLPTGAATAAKQPALGTAGTASSDVISVQGIASMTPLLATLSGTNNLNNIAGTISLPTGASTAAKQPALGTAGSASTDVISVQGIASMTPFLINPGTAANFGIYVEDAGETAAGNLMMAGAVRRDTAASSSGTTGDNSTLNVDSVGGLWTRPLDTAAAGAAVPGYVSYPGAQDASGNIAGDVVCTSSKVYDASTSGNTELVALSGSKHIYVCGYELFSAGTVNVSLVAGTGTACASAASGTPSTGTSGASASLTPAWQFTAQTGKLSAYPVHGWLLDAGSANALCLKTSGGVAVQAQVFYSQR